MLFKKKIISSIAALIIIGGGYYWYSQSSSSTKTTSFTPVITVSSGSIKNSVKATGVIYPVQNSQLTFTKQGTITAIYKREGDPVKAGDVIAEVDDTSAKLNVATAKINLSNAQNNLNKLLGGSSEVSKIQARNNLSDARAKLELLQQQYQNLIQQQSNALNTAEMNIKSLGNQLALAKSQLSYTEQTTNTGTTANNIVRDVATAYSLINQIYEGLPDNTKTLHDIIMIDNKSDPAYGDLGVNNLSNKASVESIFQSITSKQKGLDTSMATIAGNQENLDVILSGASQMADILADFNTDITLAVIEQRTSNQSINLQGAKVDANIASLKTLATTISSQLSSINSSLTTLKNYGSADAQILANQNTVSVQQNNVTNAQNSLDNAKKTLIETKNSYDTQVLQAQQGITSQENAIKLAEANYNNILNTSNTDLVSARNSVQSSQINLQQAELALKDYQIISTFDGVVKSIPWVVGDTMASSSTTQYMTITNSGGYEVDVTLDQADIVKIQPGMNAIISLDAYTDTTFTGTVSTVSPTPTVSSNVVSYTAKILFPSIAGKELYSNMTATVNITTESKDDIITIPMTAVRSMKGKSYVQVLNGQGPNAPSINTEVILGINDGTNVEVLSGLTVGQKIYGAARNISRTGSGSASSRTATSTSSTRSTFGGIGGPPSGGFGGGGGF